VVALALTTLALALPQHGVVVPSTSFGGLHLGATRKQVEAVWGRRHSRCLDCSRTTWYFTYKRFEPQGAGVSFRDGVADSFFTVWSPGGWRTDRGLVVGDPESRIAVLYGSLPRAECGRYSALVLRRGRAATQFYVYQGEVWGFGISWAGAPPCH
jgi:hypothetical protein